MVRSEGGRLAPKDGWRIEVPNEPDAMIITYWDQGRVERRPFDPVDGLGAGRLRARWLPCCHFRRYDKEPLRQLLTECGFEIDELRYLNRPGVFGWWLNSRVLKRKVSPCGQLAAFRWIQPILKLEEKTAPSFGMSLLALAWKR